MLSEKESVPKFYVGYDVDIDNKATAAYMCFKRNGIEYCLKPNGAYETNKAILEDAFKDVENACSFEDNRIDCSINSMSAMASNDGTMYASYGNEGCEVFNFNSEGGYIECW